VYSLFYTITNQLIALKRIELWYKCKKYRFIRWFYGNWPFFWSKIWI